MQLKDIDLNLLRLFDAVYRTRNVSRAAESATGRKAISPKMANFRI